MLKPICPCDLDGQCPYESLDLGTCEYWCGLELEPIEEDEEWQRLVNLSC